jgi:hypothetical protein
MACLDVVPGAVWVRIMPVNAHNLSADLNRMDDDGGPAPYTWPTARPRLVDADRAPTTGDATNDWFRRLGASHRRRDESARLVALGVQERDQARQLACHRRWPGIVDAMRTLIGCYNDGTGGDPLTLDDNPSADGEPIATVTARNGRSLVMAVEDADLWVRATEDETSGNPSERWIGLDRTTSHDARRVGSTRRSMSAVRHPVRRDTG